MKTTLEIITERLDVLAGTRTRDKSEAAVRIQDLIGILQIPTNLASKPAAAAPTKAEYDALLRDVTALQTQLRLVATALHDRLNP
jgi:hypothetical protein